MSRFVPVLALALVLAACGGDTAPQGGASAGAAAPAADPNAPSDFQLKHGIGPVTQEVTLGAPDAALAKKGEEIFTGKCSACHKMDEKYVGPALAGVVDRRGPTFVMNMVLNPEGMYQKHPEVRKLLAEYMTQMPNQQLTPDDARAVVEYLRAQPAPKS
jgi:mono/diheme cytochrome c family protein